MPTQATINAIFDIETAIESAAKAALVAHGLDSLFASANEQLRRAEVRSEIAFAVEGQPTHMAMVNGAALRDMWRGTLALQAVALEEAELKNLRSSMRYAMRDWFTALNASLTLHEVCNFEPVGDSRIMTWDEGIVSLTLRFALTVGVKPSSWATLDA